MVGEEAFINLRLVVFQSIKVLRPFCQISDPKTISNTIRSRIPLRKSQIHLVHLASSEIKVAFGLY